MAVHSKPWEKEKNSNKHTVSVVPAAVPGQNLAKDILWNPETKLVTESRGDSRGYSDRDHNPNGNLITCVDPSGRGVRYDGLNKDHIAQPNDLHVTNAQDIGEHGGKNSILGTNGGLRTVRGFTNPAPYSSKGIEAEIYRSHRDTANKIAMELVNLKLGQSKKSAPVVKPSKIKELVNQASEEQKDATRFDDLGRKK